MIRGALDRRAVLRLGLAGAATALADAIPARRAAGAATSLDDPRERHLRNMRQLTFGADFGVLGGDH